VTGQDFTNREIASLSITKHAENKPTSVKPGDVVTYNITVCNTGMANLTNVIVTDSLAPGGGYTIPVLNRTLCNTTFYAYTVLETDTCDGWLNNSATVRATDPCGDIVDPGYPANESIVAVCNPSLNITKTANTPGPVYPGQLISYTIKVCNNGDVNLSNVQVMDNRTGPYTVPGTLKPGICNTTIRTYTVTERDICNGSVVNFANVSATDVCGRPVGGITTNASVTLPVNYNTSISVTKTANTAGPVSVNQVIEYTITVCNNGNMTLNNIQVADNRTGTYTIPSLAKGACNTVKKTYTVTAQDIINGSVVNNVTATGTDICGKSVSSNAKVTLGVQTTSCCTCPTVPEFSATKIASKTMQFTDQSGGNPVYWAWNFGDGKTSTLRNPVHQYSSAGTYSVTLYVRGQDCQGVISPLAKVTKSVVVTS
jgi:uncharacterized repeat protein (TIGR01451 family)